jgi:serine/threonine protein phosphatase 1
MPIALPQAKVPNGVRIYAVGDLHGRHDLLLQLFEKIEADARLAPEPQKELIFLGDYIDRGLHVKQTLDWLMEFDARPEAKRYRLTCLGGNHEVLLLNFLRNPELGQTWLENGANETFLSFGIKLSSLHPRPETFQHLSEQLAAKLAGPYFDFLSNRPLARTVGDYFFTHAGVDPDKPLTKQKSQDLLWIRDKFLQSPKLFDKIIIHGHTISPQPEQRPNRIGIDTGAYATGRLTCLVLAGRQRKFLQT